MCESGLGDRIGFKAPHESSRDQILSAASVIFCADPPSATELAKAKDDCMVISFYAPFEPGFDLNSHIDKEKSGLRVFSMDMIPRTTLAQSMDVLSSMASISGYQAVLLAAQKLPRYFPMLMTAAGTIRPAQVLILGAGVAGLQAIATARRLGAKVEAFDVRAAVKEEVQSLGAKFVEVEGSTDDSAAGGYAVEQTEDYKRRQGEAIANSVAKADVVITTAQLRGRRAPRLITDEMLQRMKHGSVVIDMASSSGGNCAGSQDGEEVYRHGVLIIGDSALYLKTLQDASDLLANNIVNYVKIFDNGESLAFDPEDEIQYKSMIYPKAEDK